MIIFNKLYIFAINEYFKGHMVKLMNVQNGYPINLQQPDSATRFVYAFGLATLSWQMGISLWKLAGSQNSETVVVHFLDPIEKTLRHYLRYFILSAEEITNRLKRIMNRHETVIKRIKHFNVWSTPFRHNLAKHKICFHSVVNLTQLILKYEDPLSSAA